MSRRLVFVLACISGGLCLAAGVSYLFVRPTQLTISLLAACGVLGCVVLVAVGMWQRVATEHGFRALLVVGVSGLLFAAASGLGAVGAQFAHTARLEPTGVPVVLHLAGIFSGVALSVAGFTHLFTYVPHRRGVRRPHGDVLR